MAALVAPSGIAIPPLCPRYALAMPQLTSLTQLLHAPCLPSCRQVHALGVAHRYIRLSHMLLVNGVGAQGAQCPSSGCDSSEEDEEGRGFDPSPSSASPDSPAPAADPSHPSGSPAPDPYHPSDPQASPASASPNSSHPSHPSDKPASDPSHPSNPPASPASASPNPSDPQALSASPAHPAAGPSSPSHLSVQPMVHVSPANPAISTGPTGCSASPAETGVQRGSAPRVVLVNFRFARVTTDQDALADELDRLHDVLAWAGRKRQRSCDFEESEEEEEEEEKYCRYR